MSDEVFNIFATIGIGLTFFASIAATIVSIISLKTSSKAAKRTGYLNTITASREKWSHSLRESASLYFTQITHLCSSQKENLEDIYNELTHYHYAIALLLFKQDKEILDAMKAVQDIALKIVGNNSIILSQYKKNPNLIPEQIESMNIVVNARNEIRNLRLEIINKYQEEIFNGIEALLECEWRKQQYEATNI